MRTGLLTTAALGLALMLGSPALADEANPVVGDTCTADTVLPVDLVCDANGFVAPAPSPAPVDPPADPAPTPPVVTDPVPDPPVTDPVPVDPPATQPPTNPVPDPPVVSPAPGTVGGAGQRDGGGTAAGPTGPTAGGPTAGGGSSTDPSVPAPGTGIHAAATALDPASTTNSLLTSATVATLASSDLPTLAAIRSLQVAPGTAGHPLSYYTPQPLLANLPPTAQIAAVQAPLLAVGDQAAAGGGFTLAGLSSKALPGLLVVLATALVASVGAGNLRYWQDRLGRLRG